MSSSVPSRSERRHRHLHRAALDKLAAHPHLRAVGELSPFHRTFGFYVDGVDLDAIVLPDGWTARLVIVDNANTNGFRGLCLEPGDLAVSKLAAERPKHIAFVRVLLREGIATHKMIRERLAATPSIEPSRAVRLQELVAGPASS